MMRFYSLALGATLAGAWSVYLGWYLESGQAQEAHPIRSDQQLISSADRLPTQNSKERVSTSSKDLYPVLDSENLDKENLGDDNDLSSIGLGALNFEPASNAKSLDFGLKFASLSSVLDTVNETILFTDSPISGDIPLSEIPEFNLSLSAPDLFESTIAADVPTPTSETNAPASETNIPGSEGTPANETSPPASETNGNEVDSKEYTPPYVLPERGPGFRPSRASRCDSMEHLKIPRSYRRLDTYPRPEAIMPAGPTNDFFKRDEFTGDWGGLRTRLYDAGIDFYGCWTFDYVRDIISNAQEDNLAVIPPGRPVHREQRNINQLYGGDIYSRFFSKNWKGGQFHWSVSWPESLPIYTYRNRLNPSGTGQLHGHFFTDQGVGDPTFQDQGIRLFELWFQQRYGKDLRSYVRIGNIYPFIHISRSALTGIFNFWTFSEPCMFGTNYFVGNAPCYPQAPFGLQIYHIFNDNLDFAFQVNQGYYASTGRNNRRGITWDLRAVNGVEGVGEFTYRGGTYSLKPNDRGKPWYFRLGGHFHTGLIYNNHLDYLGGEAALTNLPRRNESGRGQVYTALEVMVYREKGSYSKGLTLFAKAGSSFREEVNSVKRWATAGFGYEGLFPGRDRDVLYGGWGRLIVTDGVQIFQRLDEPCRNSPGCVINGTQDVFELGYSMELTPWLYINPMFQYIRNPNTRHDLGNIFTFGITTRISF